MATELFPIISTTDLPRSLGFYRDLLGGAVTFEFPGSGGVAVYVGLELGRSHLGIGVEAEPPPTAGPVSLWVYVDDCDATIGRLRQGGVPIVEEPVDQAWGERVAAVTDPDGLLVRVASRTSP